MGDMQAAPARYVSVSELYSTDEVELLLDEIRELEPTSCRGEDVQVPDTTHCTYYYLPTAIMMKLKLLHYTCMK